MLNLDLLAQGFLKTMDQQIVNEANEPVILRGMGLGGWMLQEGYMLQTGSFAPTQHEIQEKISQLIGPEKTREFYDAWYANHVRKIDIDSLKAWGFNSVRLPMHYNLYTLPIEQEPIPGQNTWLDKGFIMTDMLLQWCKDNQMYLILDLHAAPGGQGKNAAISDYDPSKPSLWESEANQQKTIALWRKLAQRYADEPSIGGYDLINEPNWSFEGKSENGCDDTGNQPIWNLYQQITQAIREVDQQHIIFVEGNCWSQNINGFPGPWDENMSLSFHKYWSPTTSESLQKFLSIREQFNIPLWMGEAGENSNEWFKQAIALFEKHEIGWAWWPMKKIGSIVGPLTVLKTPEYQQLLDYWKAGGTKPSPQFTYNTLMEMAERLKLENCQYHPDVIDAMFRQRKSNNTLAFSSNILPGTIQAAGFDLGELNQAYFDLDYMNTGEGKQTSWNQGHAFRNDGIDIKAIADDNKGGYYIGWINPGEWMKYTVDVSRSGDYLVSFRIASAEGSGKLRIKLNGKILDPTVHVQATGGEQVWQEFTFPEKIKLNKGKQELVILIEQGGFNLSTIKLEN